MDSSRNHGKPRFPGGLSLSALTFPHPTLNVGTTLLTALTVTNPWSKTHPPWCRERLDIGKIKEVRKAKEDLFHPTSNVGTTLLTAVPAHIRGVKHTLVVRSASRYWGN